MGVAVNLEAKTIPHETHRYSTVGDYWDDESGKHFRISDMNNEDYEFLVLIHELVEEHLTRRRGILEPDIKVFDEAFEAQRQPGNVDEAGDDPAAPYRKEHQFATLIERFLSKEMGVDWDAYDKTINSL